MPRGRNRRDAQSLLARAEMQTTAGANVLFGRLDALSTQRESEREQAAALFARWAERLHSGAWSPEIADLVARASAIELDLAGEDAKA